MNSLAGQLLQWYEKNRNEYPWRANQDPYRVWLSEVLLQQTRIPVATRYYLRILEHYPTLADLARADDQTFLSLWSGAGYYRRGVNMLACARQIISRHQGKFPIEQNALLALPGIGSYTAGAIRNICHGILTPAADGNIARVLSRVAKIQDIYGSGAFHQKLRTTFLKLGHDVPSGDYFQALMELGERICLPDPKCCACPVRRFCLAYRTGEPHMLPRKPETKKAKSFHWYFLILRRNGQSLFTRNPERQFLRDAWLFPDFLAAEEVSRRTVLEKFRKTWGVRLSNYHEEKGISHAVTFRRICAHLIRPAKLETLPIDGKWLTADQLKQYPTSSIAFKILQLL